MALLGLDTAPVSAAIDECIELLHDDPIRILRIRGLPRVPLTLPRIVEELGAGQRDGQPADDDELIVRVLASRGNQESLVALIIEQAELLPLPTLAFLQVASTVFGTRTPRLQLIFAGHPRFEQLLVRGELVALRERLQSVVRVARLSVGAAETMPVHVASEGAAGRPRIARRFGRRSKILVGLLGSMLVIAAATFAITQPSDPVRQANQATRPIPPSAVRADPPSTGAPGPAPARPQSTPSPSLPPPTAIPQTVAPQADLPQPAAPPGIREVSPAPPAPRNERGAAPSGEQLARLRGDFDRFLAQTEWGSKRLGEGERTRLFNEYLRWNYGAATANPALP